MSMHDAIELGSKHIKDTVGGVVDAEQTYERAGYGPPQDKPLLSSDDDDRDYGATRHKQSLVVQVVIICLIGLLFAGMFVIISVSSATYDKVSNYKTGTTVTTVYESIGLPGFEGFNWNDVTAAAAGGEVHWYTYNGPRYNAWIDDWLIPQVSKLYNIDLIRHPIDSTPVAVDQVIDEIAAGYGMNNGSIDLIWINGENFATLKNLGYAYGPWAYKTPNAANYDFSNDAIEYDFGLATAGYEMPYNEAQVVFIANEAYVNHTMIDNINDLLTWIKGDGQGKFTYAAPASNIASDGTITSDPTGAVFIRHMWYKQASYETFLGTFDETLYLKYAPAFYQELRSLEPYLYSNASMGLLGKYNTYPVGNTNCDKLVTNGYTWVTLSYDPGHATTNIENGVWPSTMMSFVLTSGTIGNTNFVLIPANAKNKLAAVVVADYIASAEAMFSRAQPENLGTLQAYDESSDNFAGGGWSIAFDYIDRPLTTPSKTTLDAYKVGELTSAYITRLEKDWYYCVLNYVSGQYSYCG